MRSFNINDNETPIIIGVDDRGVVFANEFPPQYVYGTSAGGINAPVVTIHALHPPTRTGYAVGTEPVEPILTLGDTLPVSKPVRDIRPKPRQIISTTGVVNTQTTTTLTQPAIGAAFDLKTFAQDNALLLLVAAGVTGYLVLKGK